MKKQETSFFSTLLTLLSFGLGAGFLRNAIAAEPELDETARQLVCEGGGATCKARSTTFERGAFGRTWWFELGSGTVVVRCERQYLVLGDYVCKRPASAPPRPTGLAPAVTR